MNQEEHRFPRELLHPVCDDNEPGVRSPGSPHHHEDEDCETLDSQMAWNIIVNRAGLNADLLIEAKHTDTEFVWTFERPDPPSDDELLTAKLALEEQAAVVAQRIAAIDRALEKGDG